MVEQTFIATTNAFLVDQTTGNGIINNSATPVGRLFVAGTQPDYSVITLDDTGGNPDIFDDDQPGGHVITDGAGIVPDGTEVESESVHQLRLVDPNTGDPIGPVINVFVFSQNGQTSNVWGLSADAAFIPGATYIKVAGSNAGASEYTDLVICFVSGTQIRTPEGLRRVEDIAVGDEIWTSKDNASVVRWVGRRTAPCEGALAPIRFETGTIGNARPLLVSPEHRMVIRGSEPELLFGEGAVLTAAKHLLDLPGVTRVTGGVVTYHHFMFDDHAIVEAEGALSESFYAGPAAIDALEDGPRAELLSLFPELEAGQTAPLAMRSLTAVEAKALTGRLHAA